MRTLVILAGLAAATSVHAEDGKALFATRCAACHQPAASKSSSVAPKIAGVVGRRIAGLTDYAYSAGLKGKGAQAWSDASLDAYVAAPAKFAPGTRMFVALAKPEERRAVIGYLKTLR